MPNVAIVKPVVIIPSVIKNPILKPQMVLLL